MRAGKQDGPGGQGRLAWPARAGTRGGDAQRHGPRHNMRAILTQAEQARQRAVIDNELCSVFTALTVMPNMLLGPQLRSSEAMIRLFASLLLQ